MTVSDLEQFYTANLPKIYRFFFYKVLNRETAEDLTSQTFLKFTKELNSTEIENPKAYIYGIARFVALDYLRSKYKKNEFPLNDDDDCLESENDNFVFDAQGHLEELLPNIPEKQASVLRLRFLDMLSLKEIAEKLGKDVNYVSTTQKRGLQRIKDLLACTDTTTNIVR